MRRLFSLVFCVLSLLASSQLMAAAGLDPLSHFFHETFGDFAEELEQAREEDKQGILLFYEMDDCPFCQFMKENVLNQPEVQDFYREHFRNFMVDIEGDIEIQDFSGQEIKQKDFAKLARVRATPVIAFYDLTGKEIFRHTGRTSGVDEFLLMGKFIVDGAYKEQKFIVYKREHLKR
ncbi:MAG: thioredoxin family protein [Thiohalomonadaceae bacterium]